MVNGYVENYYRICMYTIKKQYMYTYKIYNNILTLHRAYTIIRVQGNWN